MGTIHGSPYIGQRYRDPYIEDPYIGIPYIETRCIGNSYIDAEAEPEDGYLSKVVQIEAVFEAIRVFKSIGGCEMQVSSYVFEGFIVSWSNLEFSVSKVCFRPLRRKE